MLAESCFAKVSVFDLEIARTYAVSSYIYIGWCTFSGTLAHSSFKPCMMKQKHGKALEKVPKTTSTITTTIKVMKQMYVIEYTCIL